MEPISPTSKRRPFKLFEHPLSQFNDVVIPHRLDMMEKHKSNIEKAMQLGDFASAIRAQTAAKILVQNLRRDLSEIEALRNQVDEHDLVRFDEAMKTSRSRALASLEAYISLGKRMTFSEKQSKLVEPLDDVVIAALQTAPQLQVHETNSSIQEQNMEEYARSWEKLQTDIESLHACYADLHALTEMQGELVGGIEENVEATRECVVEGNKNLRRALKYKATMYPLVGAALGTLVGGPVGFLIGLKAGGCAALGGGILGFAGGRLLKKINSPGSDTSTVEPDDGKTQSSSSLREKVD